MKTNKTYKYYYKKPVNTGSGFLCLNGEDDLI